MNIPYLFIFIFFLFITPIYASTSADYIVKIPVSEQSEKAKREAMKKGLKQILKKNLSDSKVLDNKEMQEILLKAHDYIQSYHYLNEKKKGAFQKFIQITFDKKEIADIIQQANKLSESIKMQPPIIGKEIPPTPVTAQKSLDDTTKAVPQISQKPILIWLAIKSFQQSQPQLIENTENISISDKDDEIKTLIPLIAKQKNLSIFLPKLDEENIKSEATENIWKLDKTQITIASASYSDINILAGRLEQEGNGQWQGQWQFKMGEQWSEFRTNGETPEVNLAKIFDSIQSNVNNETTADNKKESFLIQVHQVNDLEKNVKLLQYLRQLPVVSKADIISILPDRVTLEIQIKDRMDAFQKALEAEKKLIPITVLELDNFEHDIVSKNKVDLHYDWQEPLSSIAPEY